MSQKLLNFSEALDALKQGHKLARQKWSNCTNSLVLMVNGDIIAEGINDCYGNPQQEPLPVTNTLYVQIAGKYLTAWTPNQEDLFAEDWFEL